MGEKLKNFGAVGCALLAITLLIFHFSISEETEKKFFDNLIEESQSLKNSVFGSPDLISSSLEETVKIGEYFDRDRGLVYGCFNVEDGGTKCKNPELIGVPVNDHVFNKGNWRVSNPRITNVTFYGDQGIDLGSKGYVDSAGNVYTHSTKKVAGEGLIIYQERAWYIEDDQAKTQSQARSWLDAEGNIRVLEDDPDFSAELIGMNLTSLILDVNLFNKDFEGLEIPTKKDGIVTGYINFSSIVETKRVSFTAKNILEHNYSIGFESLTIEPYMGNEAGNYTYRDSSAKSSTTGNNYGSDARLFVIRTGSANWFTYAKLNISNLLGGDNFDIENFTIKYYGTEFTNAPKTLDIVVLGSNFSEGTGVAAAGISNYNQPNSTADAVWTDGTGSNKNLLSIHREEHLAFMASTSTGQYITAEFSNSVVQTEYNVDGWLKWTMNISSAYSGAGEDQVILGSREDPTATERPQIFLQYAANVVPSCTESGTNITVLEDSGAWILDSNMSVAVNISCSDTNGDALTYTIVEGAAGTYGSYTNPSNDDLIYTTAANQSGGADIVVISVSDGIESINVSAQVTVTAVEDNPWFDQIPNNTVAINNNNSAQNITVPWLDYWNDPDPGDISPSAWSAFSNDTNIPCSQDANGDLTCTPNSGLNFIITLSAEDSNGVNATTSFEVYSDSPPSVPDIILPDNGTETDNETIYLSCDHSVDPEGDLFNYSFYGDTNNPPTTLIAESDLTTIAWNVTVIGDYWWRCQACDSYGFCSSYNNTRYIKVDFESIRWLEDVVITSDQFGTGRYYYEANVSFNNLRFGDVDMVLNISNLTYDLTEDVINGSTSRFYTSISSLESWERLAVPYGWNTTLTYANDTSQYLYNDTFGGFVNVDKLELKFCNASNSYTYINISFKDEVTAASLNGSVPSSSFVYSVDSGKDLTKSYSFSESVENNSYAFCVYPWSTDIYSTTIFNYKSTGYPQRRYSADLTLTNASNNLTLYLLASADGSYTTFQVVNEADQTLGDVYVTAQIQIGGTWTTIESRYTDGSGGATFWVNPDLSHRFIFTKSGYTSQTLTITPTQSSYTVTMGSLVAAPDENYALGISYDIQPSIMVLENDTTYDFNFTINSSYFSLTSAGFILTNASGAGIGSASCSISTGCMASVTVNVGENNSKITMNYYWETNATFSNGTRSWSVARYYKGKASLLRMADDIEKFADTFDDQAHFEFTKALIAFFIIAIVTLSFTYISGIYSPLALMGVIFSTTWVLDTLNLVPSVGIDHFIVIVLGIMFVGTLVHELMR